MAELKNFYYFSDYLSLINFSTPDAFLICDGSEFSKSLYHKLYEAIGQNFGGTNSTFFVPDLRYERYLLSGPETIYKNKFDKDKTDFYHKLSALRIGVTIEYMGVCIIKYK